MHVEKDRKRIGHEILRAKSTYNLTSFSETISKEKEKRFLLSSQYENTDETTNFRHLSIELGKNCIRLHQY